MSCCLILAHAVVKQARFQRSSSLAMLCSQHMPLLFSEYFQAWHDTSIEEGESHFRLAKTSFHNYSFLF